MTRAGAWLRRADPKYFQILLITLLLVVGEYRYAILGGYDRLGAALGACVATELALSWFVRGKIPNLMSAYVSGTSLALLVKPHGGLLWPFLLGGFLAIASKYAIQYRGRHLWNPSNLAIALLLLAAPDRVSVLSHQFGNDLGTNAVIWAIGLVVVSRAGLLHVSLAYLGSFVGLGLLRSRIAGGPLLPEIAPVTGPMYQLFVLFMVTDPRTTVRTWPGRVVVVAVVALVEAGIRLAADYHLALPPAFPASPPILALALVGPVALALDLRRRGPGAGGIASAPPAA